MHPFLLNQEQIEQISGGYFPADRNGRTTMVVGEEGGTPPVPPGDPIYSTMALGEEGSLPPNLT